MANRICSVESCEKAAFCRGWCGTHYQRWRLTGTPARNCRTCGLGIDGPGQAVYCSPQCRPKCAAAGCDRPIRKMSWCGSHYQMWLTEGEIRPRKHTWGEAGGKCRLCGEAVPRDSRRRGFCSDACRVLHESHGGSRPTKIACTGCGAEIDAFERSVRSGRRKRSDVRLCRRCRRWSLRDTGLSMDQIAIRTGGACGLCGIEVDPSLPFPEPQSASVDHITPRSLGGTDELSNLQLAHLICNVRKGARLTA